MTVVEECPLVDINEAQSGEPFIWENKTLGVFPGFGGGGWMEDNDWIEHIVDSDIEYVKDLEASGEPVPESCFRSWEDFEERVEKKYPTFYSTYRLMITEKYTEILWERFQKDKCSDIITSMKFAYLWSPHDYWNTTDHLNVRMTCNWHLLDAWILEHITEFEKYLKEHWSPRESWIPLIPNVYEDLYNSPYYRVVCIDFILSRFIALDNNEDTCGYEQSFETELAEWRWNLCVEDVIDRINEMEKE